MAQPGDERDRDPILALKDVMVSEAPTSFEVIGCREYLFSSSLGILHRDRLRRGRGLLVGRCAVQRQRRRVS